MKKRKTGFVDYYAYIQSPGWGEVKARFKRHAFRQMPEHCQMCYSWGPVDVHHKNYYRLGCETLDDLYGACRDCHRFIHQNFNIGRTGTWLPQRLAMSWKGYCCLKKVWPMREALPEEFKAMAHDFFKRKLYTDSLYRYWHRDHLRATLPQPTSHSHKSN